MTLRKLLLGFNLSLLLTLCFSIALPIWLLGGDGWVYLNNNTVIIGIMLLSFIAINLYFAWNWALFDRLEKGDWPGLRDLLYTKIFEGKNYKRKCISYFIEVAIQLNDTELLRELEAELHTHERILSRFSPSHPSRHPSERQIAGTLAQIKYCVHHWREYLRGYRSYRLGAKARRRLCEYAIELGLPYLICDPGHQSEWYFGGLRDFRPFQHSRYFHKYRWAELFYAIALLVQGKTKYAAYFLEQLLLRQPRARRQLGKDALPQLVAIQLLEELQQNQNHAPCPYNNTANTASSSSTDQNDQPVLDHQLIALRRAEIQKIYSSPQHWLSYLAREQSQNIAITMIRRLIRSAYEQQLRPAHQAHIDNRKAHEKTGWKPLEIPPGQQP